MSVNKIRDFEESLKNIAHPSIQKHRKSLCNECHMKGANSFCQVNFVFLPDFQKYRYNACPMGRWQESYTKQ